MFNNMGDHRLPKIALNSSQNHLRLKPGWYKDTRASLNLWYKDNIINILYKIDIISYLKKLNLFTYFKL